MILRALYLVSFLGLPSLSLAQAEPVEIASPVEKVFIPVGWDDNDNVEVILQGFFPTTCYKVGSSKFEVDHSALEIRIWAKSYQYESQDCTEVESAFLQVVKVGILNAGVYTVKVMTTPDKSAKVEVSSRVTESPDDYLYAPVESASIELDATTHKQILYLSGRYPIMKTGCSILRDVRIRRDSNDVIVIQPIMEVARGEECVGHQLNFKMSQGLREPFSGEGLLHVRVLNGNSYNQFLKF